MTYFKVKIKGGRTGMYQLKSIKTQQMINAVYQSGKEKTTCTFLEQSFVQY